MESGLNQYRVVSTRQGVDSRIESTLVDNPDFSDLDRLTHKIERATLKFIKDVETFFMQ